MDQMMFVNVIATLKRAHWNAHKENKFGHIDLATGFGLRMACLSKWNL